jgi:hypothetical protein
MGLPTIRLVAGELVIADSRNILLGAYCVGCTSLVAELTGVLKVARVPNEDLEDLKP